MSTGGHRRSRSQRVALELPPGLFGRILESLQRSEVLLRLGMCTLAAVIMWAIVGGWTPPFPFRSGQVPPRDVTARVSFEVENATATEDARRAAERRAVHVYTQDPAALIQLRTALKNQLAQINAAPTLEQLPAGIWREFLPPEMPNVEPLTPEEQEAQYQQFRDAIDTKEKLEAFEKALDRAFTDIEQKGLLDRLQQESDEGNQSEIYVHPRGVTEFPSIVKFSEVRTPEAIARLHDQLRAELQSGDNAQRVFFWLEPKLSKTKTLQKDKGATASEIEKVRKAVEPRKDPFEPGKALAAAAAPLTAKDLELLRHEYNAALAQRTAWQNLWHSLATFGMFVALYTLSGFYIYFREPALLADLRRFAALLILAVATVALCKLTAGDPFRAEMIPLLLFGMTVAIAYGQELGLLLAAEMGLVVAFGLGENLAQYVIMLSGVATAIYLANPIRSRSKLIYVGLCSGLVVTLTAVGVGVLDGRSANLQLLQDAGRLGVMAIVAGFLMTGLLPFIEKAFGVLTDISLLEIGDVSHPLLQELVRRAPGTYNHSINVASIGEAAAEAIGGRGLLVRVGAYFHDIGKMLKPHYFAENQGQGASRHETLMPAMSTLIIIAHIKDGADLARQHHLPLPIIDFIMQHHGTTLVEYFYRRASEKSESDPNGGEVDERSYRYPGPKPQSKEAAVLMLADAAESASRALVEPTPARLDGLVHDIAMKRLLDGQFDESGLTLQELNMVEDTLVKSLTAVYHSRVKYPDQKSA